MITIGRIPRCLSSFFRPQRRLFPKRAWPHFWGLVTAIAMGTEHTVERLNALLRGHGHRTNDGEFLWRSHWDEAGVLQGIALRLLNRVYRTGEAIYFILDDTQTLKRAKKMDAVGRLYHHASGTYGTGHTILKGSLYCAGVTIPWGSWLYVKKEHAGKLKIPFTTLTELAGEAIRGLPLPPTMNITVLFDAYYLCATVAKAVEAKGWHYIGVGKSNRRFTANAQSHRLSTYGPNVLRRSGKWMKITGLQKTHNYRVAHRTGSMKKLGVIRVVFSRRRGDKKPIALITNDLTRPARKVVADYLRRWAVELLIKDEKQHLGLGAYRVLRYRAVVRHLHLVDCAYACLTHLGMDARTAQGHKKKETVLRLPPIRQLKAELRQAAWNEAVTDVVKVSHERPVIRRLEKLLAA
jgi:SRSO17 transposase